MCGIVAAVGDIDVNLCRRMLERLEHRGPDDRGEVALPGAWLGHQRLSIMDVSRGRQPLSDRAGNAFVAGNGEIYNHLTVRDTLPDGLNQTGSDTETALHELIRRGPAGLASLDGMFAIAYADRDGNFLVARDPVGIKPLYWAEVPGGTLFASELRAFDPDDRAAVRTFPPGHCWTPEGGLARFADAIPARLEPVTYPEGGGDEWGPDLPVKVREGIVAAVEAQMMSDVPLGVLLSGGLDSAIVAAIAADWARRHGRTLPTFAVGSATSSDLRAARQVAEHLGTDHHEIVPTAQDLAESLDRAVSVIEHFDPSLVRSAVPNLLLAREASKHVRVVLTGEGADELFAGYSYLHEQEFDAPASLHAELVRLVGELHHLNLQRCDRATMAYGLEARVPFLDTAVISMAMGIPAAYKTTGGNRPEKLLLRQAFEGWLPENVLYRKKEQFGDGSGAADALRAIIEKIPSVRDVLPAGAEGAALPTVKLRDQAETAYYQIWMKNLTGINPTETLGAFATT